MAPHLQGQAPSQQLSAETCQALPCGPGFVRRQWCPCRAAWTSAPMPWPHICPDAGHVTPVPATAFGVLQGCLYAFQHYSFQALLMLRWVSGPLEAGGALHDCLTSQHPAPSTQGWMLDGTTQPAAGHTNISCCSAGLPRRLSPPESRHLLRPPAGSLAPVPPPARHSASCDQPPAQDNVLLRPQHAPLSRQRLRLCHSSGNNHAPPSHTSCTCWISSRLCSYAVSLIQCSSCQI